MAITTFAELQTALQEEIEDYSQEYTNQLPNLINRAEQRLYRELDSFALVVRTTVTLAPNEPLIAQSTTAGAIRYVAFRTPGTNRMTFLKQRSPEYLMMYWPDFTSVGTPEYYCQYDAGDLQIAPCVSVTTEFTVAKQTQPTYLSNSNTSNILLAKYGDCLFDASMVESNRFLKNWDAVPVWESSYQQKIITAQNEGRRERRDDAATPNNTNNLNNLTKEGQ